MALRKVKMVATHSAITGMTNSAILGLLEGSRVFQGYRMVVFGGLVAILLVFRPRGLLDEKVVHCLKARFLSS